MREAGGVGLQSVALVAFVALVAACVTSRPSHVAKADLDQACAGVATGDQMPGVEGLEITRAEALERGYPLGGFVAEGIGLHVRLRGRTQEDLHGALRCRVARSRVLGDPRDPLSVVGARLRVLRGAEDEAIVHLRSRNLDVAKEITARFRAVMEVADMRDDWGDDPWTAPPRSPGRAGQGTGATVPGVPIRP